MAKLAVQPTGRESFFDADEFIVSKTDIKGRITYANDVFLRMAKLTEKEAIGAPHSVIRHPDMPRSIFKFLWDQILSGKELFAYVVNLAANGDHYWVFAHVTPSRDESGNIIGFHSNRRKPDPAQVAKIQPLYRELLAIESQHSDRKEGLARATAKLAATIQSTGMSYDEFIFTV
jgi:PAS domain S-box-containing protein